VNSPATPTVLDGREAEPSVVESQTQLQADFESTAARDRSFLLKIAVASTRNPADAEDVVQEALMRGYRGLPGFRRDCPMRIWLARIVVRVAINHRRSLVRNLRRWTLFGDLERDDGEGRVEPFEAPAPGPGVDRESLMDVQKHVDRLPEEFRIPLMLFASKGMTIPEIAGILEIPEGTVKSRIFYGRKRLRKGLRL
jgi:RNA polymerase sigma-70 factor (ECF subfamily)